MSTKHIYFFHRQGNCVFMSAIEVQPFSSTLNIFPQNDIELLKSENFELKSKVDTLAKLSGLEAQTGKGLGGYSSANVVWTGS